MPSIETVPNRYEEFEKKYLERISVYTTTAAMKAFDEITKENSFLPKKTTQEGLAARFIEKFFKKMDSYINNITLDTSERKLKYLDFSDEELRLVDHSQKLMHTPRADKTPEDVNKAHLQEDATAALQRAMRNLPEWAKKIEMSNVAPRIGKSINEHNKKDVLHVAQKVFAKNELKFKNALKMKMRARLQAKLNMQPTPKRKVKPSPV